MSLCNGGGGIVKRQRSRARGFFRPGFRRTDDDGQESRVAIRRHRPRRQGQPVREPLRGPAAAAPGLAGGRAPHRRSGSPGHRQHLLRHGRRRRQEPPGPPPDRQAAPSRGYPGHGCPATEQGQVLRAVAAQAGCANRVHLAGHADDAANCIDRVAAELREPAQVGGSRTLGRTLPPSLAGARGNEGWMTSVRLAFPATASSRPAGVSSCIKPSPPPGVKCCAEFIGRAQ